MHRRADLKDFDYISKATDELTEAIKGVGGVVHCPGGIFSTDGVM
ncbi:hypothetical protein OXIME_000621 [Oxyplasma meridianum]|uniref:Uncharacterized protein n=1 Tax=Oxyplasma meridianum TaxID=3073602 RepID=A0AAX4NGH6_9ARCH